jgi:hypothetical protein
MPTTATVPAGATTISVKTSDAAAMIAVLLEADQPVMLHGNPGIGKSDIVRQASALRGARCIDVRVSTLDAVDLRGLPTVVNGSTSWATPSFFPRDPNEDVTFFADELNRGSVSIMNGMLELCLDRRLGDYRFPSRVRVVAAVNDKDVGVSPMPSALMLRFTHVYIVPDVKDWVKWAAANDIAPVVHAFIRFRPELLSAFDPKSPSSPNPRGWAFISKIVKNHSTLNEAARYALYCGTVGEAAGVEFSAFEKVYKDLPSISNIFLNPTTAHVPTGSATIYAVAGALAAQATQANMTAVMVYLQRLPSEYQVFSVTLATKRDENLCNNGEYIKWASKNVDLF